MHTIKSNTTSNRGIVALPLVIGLTILIASVGIAISVLGFNEVINSSRFSDTDQALLYAESGVKDALQRIHFNKNYADISAPGYTIDFSLNSTGCTPNWNGCVTVWVYNSIGGTVLSPSVIVSEGRYKDSFRTLNVGAVTATDSSGRLVNTIRYEVKNLPVVFTAQATNIATNDATLNVWINPNGNATTTHFRRWSTAPDNCEDTGGTREPALASSDIDSGSGSIPAAFSLGIAGTPLSTNTTYYYCAITSDGTNTILGGLYSFKTL